MPDDPAWPPIAQRRARKVKVLSHYKFYLAFENHPVDDYVSEKVSIIFTVYSIMALSHDTIVHHYIHCM
jgi:hypothetical protein